MDFELYRWLGLIGVVFYLAAYGALQMGFLRGSSYLYTSLNLIGAALVLLSLAAEFNLSTALINSFWVLFSLIGLGRLLYFSYISRMNEEEAAFIEAKFRGLSKPSARQFLNSGEWVDAPAGAKLAVEKEPLGALIFVASGSADVTISRKTIGTCGQNSFVGEMTCFDGGPATATVTVSDDARVFRIETPSLNKVAKQDEDLRFHIESALGRESRAKLIATNKKLLSAEP